MKRTGKLALALPLLWALLARPLAVAQETVTVADCTQDAGCSALKQQAAERSRSGDATEALRLYKLAYEVRPDPRLLFNIARLLHRQDQRAEAAAHYRRFIDAPIQDDEQKQKAREYLAQLEPDEGTRGAGATAATPVYKKWWFWTIIGGVVAAGVAGGVAGGVLASQRLPEPTLRPFAP